MYAYGYCRYSSTNQNELSIEQQHLELQKYAENHNINIIKFFDDKAKSGTKDNRDNFQNMINECKKKEVQAVLVWKTDRFARNTQDSLYYKMKLEKLNIDLISITQPIDTSSPEGNLMYTMLASIDEYYSKNLASNVKRAMNFNANQCLSNGGTAPLGYDIIDRKYVVNQKESKIIQFIYNQYLKGYSYYDIINQCNQKGYKTKKGLPFRKNSIYEILHNEKYIGTYIYNKSSGNNRHKINDNIIKIENAFQPIITKKQFEEVQEKTKSNKHSTAQYKAKEIYLLSGLIFCGKCGARYTGQTTHKQKNGKDYSSSYYVCGNRNKIGKCNNHRINRYLIEDEITKLLYNQILNGNSIEVLLEKVQVEFNKLVNENNIYLNQLKIDLKQVNKQINNLILLASENPLKSILNKIQILENEKEDIEFRLNHLDITLDNKITANKIKEILNKDIKELKNGSKMELKKIINKYIKKIIVYDDKITIDYTFTNIEEVLNISSFGSPRPHIFKTVLEITKYKAKTRL